MSKKLDKHQTQNTAHHVVGQASSVNGKVNGKLIKSISLRGHAYLMPGAESSFSRFQKKEPREKLLSRNNNLGLYDGSLEIQMVLWIQTAILRSNIWIQCLCGSCCLSLCLPFSVSFSSDST